MNYAYLLSVVGSRGVTLVTIVILSHLLSAGDFGIYALAATNALLTQIVGEERRAVDAFGCRRQCQFEARLHAEAAHDFHRAVHADRRHLHRCRWGH